MFPREPKGSQCKILGPQSVYVRSSKKIIWVLEGFILNRFFWQRLTNSSNYVLSQHKDLLSPLPTAGGKSAPPRVTLGKGSGKTGIPLFVMLGALSSYSRHSIKWDRYLVPVSPQ